MRSPRTSLGLFLTLGANYERAEFEERGGEREESGISLALSAGPALRRYGDTRGRVAPFFYGSAQAGYRYFARKTDDRDGPDDHGLDLNLSAGIGLEWFPTGRVSVSGQTGLGTGAAYRWSEFEERSAEQWSVRLGTFTSALTLNLYLPAREHP